MTETAIATACPECSGLQMPLGHPAGILAWRHSSTCVLGIAEDATAAADAARLDARSRFVRDSTETERTLLAELGHTWQTEPLATFVESITPGVRFRGWADITQETT